jgi:HK97 gp10 family phage protein
MLTFAFNKKSKQEFLKYLKGLEGEILSIVQGEMEDSLLKIEEKAANEVAVNTGALKNSIQSKPIKTTKKSVEGGVFVGAHYAPYVEFGTGTEVEVPKELVDFAKQFKGKGKRKVNLPARPFFYPEVFNQSNELPKNIEKSLKIFLNKKK